MQILISSAAVTVALLVPSVGTAQSVLERVLGQVENSTNLAPVNGVYANIAESVSDITIMPAYQTEMHFEDAQVTVNLGFFLPIRTPSSSGEMITSDQLGYERTNILGEPTASMTISETGLMTFSTADPNIEYYFDNKLGIPSGPYGDGDSIQIPLHDSSSVYHRTGTDQYWLISESVSDLYKDDGYEPTFPKWPAV
ncbi:hypothetical protein AAFO90_24520 [Phaeobacter sp. CAU 1743]|uniref:hypothetical protein n=1 Tax=Phaeobacter sp. CAU 1743 TaxID=3140367 RepID=UPI00325AFC2C